MKFKISLFCFFLYFILLITSSGTCATDSFYEKCIDQDNFSSFLGNTITSNTKNFYYNFEVVPYHNTRCLLAFHLTVNNFEDVDYFNSRNRAIELLQFDLSYQPNGNISCVRFINLSNYLLSTQQRISFYLTKLIRYFLIKLTN